MKDDDGAFFQTERSIMSSKQPDQPIRFYSFPYSGHCHRVAMLLSELQLPHETINVDLANKAHKSEAFLAMNPFGQVPVIQDGEVTIADSLAILTYLSERYGAEQWAPRTPLEAAEIQRWFALAAGALAFGPAAARASKLFNAPVDLPAAQARSVVLFDGVDRHLARGDYLAGQDLTLADLAFYAYVARAPEGDVSLDPYSQIRSWLARVESMPRFVPMPTFPKR